MVKQHVEDIREVQYLAKNLVAPNDPYVIAISDRNVPLAAMDFGPPNILKTVLGIGDAVFTFTPGRGDLGGDTQLTYPFRPTITKSSGSAVTMTVSQDPAYDDVSAVIVSFADATSMPTAAGADFRLVHNPRARNRLPLGFLRCGEEFSVQGPKLVLKKWNAP